MYRMCLHKKVYRTLEYAEAKAKKFTKLFGLKFHVYTCPLCGYYHLTTKEKGNCK